MTPAAIAPAAGLAPAGLAALPFSLPGHARVERSALVPAAPEAVCAILSTSAGFDRTPHPRPRPRPCRHLRRPGRRRRRDLHLDGPGTQTIVAVEPGARVVMQRDLGAKGRPVQPFALTPGGGSPQVTRALDAAPGTNPPRRVFGPFAARRLGSAREVGLADLSRVATGA